MAFAIRTPGRWWSWRGTRGFHSASVLKPMLMLAYLDRRGVRDRGADRPRSRAAVADDHGGRTTWPRARVLGDGRRRGAARASRAAPGWRDFRAVVPDVGPLADHGRGPGAVLLADRAAAAGAASGVRARAAVVGGALAAVGYRPACRCPTGPCTSRVAGAPGTGAVDHQVALLARGDERVAVAVLTENQGTHAYGKETLRGVIEAAAGRAAARGADSLSYRRLLRRAGQALTTGARLQPGCVTSGASPVAVQGENTRAVVRAVSCGFASGIRESGDLIPGSAAGARARECAGRWGAEGEERVARDLEKRCGSDVVFLHDRRVPRSRANIDHLLVAPSGVWVD